MNAEERVFKAISLTRSILGRALNNPEVLVHMADLDVAPNDIEEAVIEILCYLEKTAPEKPKEAEV